ncbi:MAG: carboxymuconolactone decarboxylase family protein [Thermoleophilia bacterium]|nr:carboxymuconolactone decarboxylase family protein [Thermoleophilia bacterium]
MNVKADAPDGYRALAGLTRAGHPDHVLSELIKVRASLVNGCEYCVVLHSDAARAAGVSEDQLIALADWRESTLFDDRVRAAMGLTDLLTRTESLAGCRDAAAEPIWNAAQAAFPDAELAQVVVTITAINAWNRVMIASGVTPPG